MTTNGFEWQPYEGGHSIGGHGPQDGTIMRDEEHPRGARLTLERDSPDAPYAITALVYGLGDHVRFIADEPTAQHACDEMRAALGAILALLPLEDDPDYGARFDAATDALAAFAERFA